MNNSDQPIDSSDQDNPFLPPKSGSKTLSLSKLLPKLVYGPILILIRLPLIAIILLWLSFYHGFLSNLIFISEIRRAIDLVVNLIWIRIIFLLSGYYRFYCNVCFFSDRGGQLPNMKSGDIILCNQTSPIDVLYLSYIASPTFVKVFYLVKNDKTQALLAPLTFKEALKYAFSRHYRIPIKGTDAEISKQGLKRRELKNLANESAQEKHGPIAIFFEGALTNGESFLEMNEILGEEIRAYTSSTSRHQTSFSLRYGSGQINPARNQVWQYILTLANLWNHLDVTIVPIKNSYSYAGYSSDFHQVYTQVHKLKRSKLTYEDYRNFLIKKGSNSPKGDAGKVKKAQ